MERKKEQSSGPKSDWMSTYGDLVTLLMCFFILLFSMSVVDATKFDMVADSFKGAFTVQDGSPGVLDGGTQISTEDFTLNIETIKDQIQEELGERDVESTVDVYQDERGFVISIVDAVLFETAESTLRPDAIPVMDAVASYVGTLSNEIIVEGHTDNLPISTAHFPTNWELSTGRACTVVRFFTENAGLLDTRFSAVGYGETRPVSDNSTARGRQDNRRVDIIIVE